ncbi:glycosyltransferase family 4 protein [Clavibacter sp. VKM Ac-2873]|uniref:glycosyltransferase family 4 protein n=1 Tax=Clavibacter sp. VKM Ac-2873 TaxID=2783813 RepID=UPI00188ADA7B|nr:glycosyltransferase family 4 protein [Clavibacter sp. VKM Ac-2873]
MTTTLRVIIDQLTGPALGGIGRYAEDLTTAIVAATPSGCEVEGVVSAITPEQTADLEARLPGLARVTRVPLPRRELSRAWQLGLPTPGTTGMVHAPGLLAPLRRHDRVNTNDQIVATIHDVNAWTHPESMTSASVSWTKAMAKRARKHADAVVVPSHALAEELARYVDLGDRVRVIGGAVSPRLALPADPDARAAELDLPADYLLTVGSLEPRKGVQALVEALARPETGDLPLLIVGSATWGDVELAQVADEAGVDPARVRSLGSLADADLAVALDRATVFVHPSLSEGFGLPVVEALSFGTPVVHSDAPALLEVAADAGVVVPREDAAGYPLRLAEAIGGLLSDTAARERLAVVGQDRARAFSWRDSAEKVWQLHADL